MNGSFLMVNLRLTLLLGFVLLSHSVPSNSELLWSHFGIAFGYLIIKYPFHHYVEGKEISFISTWPGALNLLALYKTSSLIEGVYYHKIG
ncbi:hypothetical protein GGR55DRAFT_652023 [Xylaria sp. FL0064]|nr:hypothetical protein GGR55DRAFT_652023 [Xylaria sp. FL0064]